MGSHHFQFSAITLFSVIALCLMMSPQLARADQLPIRFNLVPASDAIAACLPNATAAVTFYPRAERAQGVDTLQVNASGLPPNTTFVLFLTELPVPPFGAVEYVGDLTTNASGQASVRVNAIIEEAFSSQLSSDGSRQRVELDHIVFWFGDPAADDVCLGAGQGPVTPFDGDGEAGTAAMSSKNFLPGAPLP